MSTPSQCYPPHPHNVTLHTPAMLTPNPTMLPSTPSPCYPPHPHNVTLHTPPCYPPHPHNVTLHTLTMLPSTPSQCYPPHPHNVTLHTLTMLPSTPSQCYPPHPHNVTLHTLTMLPSTPSQCYPPHPTMAGYHINCGWGTYGCTGMFQCVSHVIRVCVISSSRLRWCRKGRSLQASGSWRAFLLCRVLWPSCPTFSNTSSRLARWKLAGRV